MSKQKYRKNYVNGQKTMCHNKARWIICITHSTKQQILNIRQVQQERYWLKPMDRKYAFG